MKVTYGRKSLFGLSVPDGYETIVTAKHGNNQQAW